MQAFVHFFYKYLHFSAFMSLTHAISALKLTRCLTGAVRPSCTQTAF